MNFRGRIISTASVCGRVSLPGLGPYTVSKYGVEAYCDTLRQSFTSLQINFRLEMKQFNVKVIIYEPGFFQTPLTNPKRVVKIFKNIWDRCSEQTRKEYGQAFYEFCKCF